MLLADKLTRDDVVGVYAGLRPLLAGESDSTSKLSREHAVASPVRGLVMVAGGKYTTYRVMAKDAVDAAVHGLGRSGVPESCTEDVPLLGADGYQALWHGREILAERVGLRGPAGRAPAQPVRVAHRGDPDHDRRAIPSSPSRWPPPRSISRPRRSTRRPMKARCTWTTSWPGAPGSRSRPRTGAWPPPRRSPTSWPRSLGWDAATADREVEHYRARVKAELESQKQPDDHTADAARLGAPDVRLGGTTPPGQ